MFVKKAVRYLIINLLRVFYKAKYVHFLGVNTIFVFAFFQRLLRINGRTEWPVHWTSSVSGADKIQLADYKTMPGYMPGCYIQAINGMRFGKNVIIAPGVKIVSASHDVNDFPQHVKAAPISIGDNCWLAANSVVLPGVTLGNHTIVAAGAVVNKSFPEGNCIIGGVPAKLIKKIGNYKTQA